MASRSFTYYLPSYGPVLRDFRNGVRLAWAHHRRSSLDEAVFWDRQVIRNVPGRGGFVDTLVEIWGLHEYTCDGFYTPHDSDVVLDIGANIGLFSIWVARQAPGATVLAFEPMSENYSALRQNLQGWTHQVTAHEAALGAAAGVGTMQHGGERSLDHRLTTGGDSDGAHVPIMTLDDAVALTGGRMIDLCKVDIEGAEADVFGAASIDILRRVRRISLEYHDHIRPGTRRDLEEILSRTHRIVHADGSSYGVIRAELMEGM